MDTKIVAATQKPSVTVAHIPTTGAWQRGATAADALRTEVASVELEASELPGVGWLLSQPGADGLVNVAASALSGQRVCGPAYVVTQ